MRNFKNASEGIAERLAIAFFLAIALLSPRWRFLKLRICVEFHVAMKNEERGIGN